MTTNKPPKLKPLKPDEQSIFDNGYYLLSIVAYYGEGHVALNLLKQFVLAYENVSLSTAYRRIKKLIDAKFLSTHKRFDASIVSITRPAYARTLNVNYAKARVPDLTEERFKRSLFKTGYALYCINNYYPSFDAMLEHHLKHSNLLTNGLQSPSPLIDTYKATKDTLLKQEFDIYKAKNNSRKEQIQNNFQSFTDKKKTYKSIYDSYYDKYLRIDPNNAEYLANKKVQEHKMLAAQQDIELLPQPIEKSRHDKDYVNIQMLHKRNIYIADIDHTQSYIHLIFLDVNRRCTPANLKKDLYAIDNMIGRIFTNSIEWKNNLKITIYCSSYNRAQVILKQKKEVVYHLTDQVLKCNYIAELYNVLPLSLDEYVYEGKFIII